MRKSLTVAAFASLALSVVTGAAMADDEVEFTVQEATGGLTLSTAGGTTTLAAAPFDPLGTNSLTGTLSEVTVTDQRGQLLGPWAVQVSGEDWVNGDNASVTVAASNGRVYFNVADPAALEASLGGLLSGMSVTGGEFTAGTNDLGAPYTLLSGTTTLGNGQITYTPTISVTVPANTPAGTYTATVTQTLS